MDFDWKWEFGASSARSSVWCSPAGGFFLEKHDFYENHSPNKALAEEGFLLIFYRVAFVPPVLLVVRVPKPGYLSPGT